MGERPSIDVEYYGPRQLLFVRTEESLFSILPRGRGHGALLYVSLGITLFEVRSRARRLTKQ